VHVMFSSEAQDENYSIDYRWMTNFHRVQGVFGHEGVHEYCTQLTVNDKGGSDFRVLNQCLTGYQERLYPDADDVPGKRLLYNIDAGPGRLDEESLAEKQAHGIYLFPGAQNTTQVHQEMDQNYGQFKSDVRWNIGTL
jgi:predicted molibdopterin-dependent oxidoreductase YjgC